MLAFLATFIPIIGLGLGFGLVLAWWAQKYEPTQIRLDLALDYMTFKLSEEINDLNKLKTLSFSSIKIYNFTRIDLNPKQLTLVEPSSHLVPLSPTSQVINATNEHSKSIVTLKNAVSSSDYFGSLDILPGLFSAGNEVTLDFKPETDTQPPVLSIKIERKFAEEKKSAQIHLIYNSTEKFLLKTTDSQVRKTEYQGDSLTFEGNLKEIDDRIEVQVQFPVILKLELPTTDISSFSNEILIFSSESKIRMESLNFIRTKRVENDLRNETAIKKGEISYPEYPKIGKVFLAESDFLGLNEKNQFFTEKLWINTEGINLRIHGYVEHDIFTYPMGFPHRKKERRLTIYDTFTEDRFWMIMFNLVVWIIPVSIGVLGLFIVVRVKPADSA